MGKSPRTPREDFQNWQRWQITAAAAAKSVAEEAAGSSGSAAAGGGAATPEEDAFSPRVKGFIIKAPGKFLKPPPSAKPGELLPLIGYVDKLSARPGEKLQFKVSSNCAPWPVGAHLVKVKCADANPDGPGIREDDLSREFFCTFPSRLQPLSLGSFMVTNPDEVQKRKLHVLRDQGFTLVAIVCPTLPSEGTQAVISMFNDEFKDGVMLCIVPGKGATLKIGISPMYAEETPRGKLPGGMSAAVSAGRAMRAGVWYVVWATYDPEKHACCAGQFRLHPPVHNDNSDDGWAMLQLPKNVKVVCSGNSPLCVAAAVANIQNMTSRQYLFNGKIESPTVYNMPFDPSTKISGAAMSGGERALALAAQTMRRAAEGGFPLSILARWAFEKGISGVFAADMGDHGFHGRLINLPTRGVKGSKWSGRCLSWSQMPEDYAAIHFHQDDLDDARWKTDFSWTVPEGLKSGAYAMRLNCSSHQDTIPFFVLPPKGQTQADLCVLIPSLTYIIYGNHCRGDFKPEEWHARAASTPGAYQYNPKEHAEHYGASTYNLHKDGSGICHCTHLRPLLTLKSGFTSITEAGSGVRHYQADTHLLAWLAHEGIAFDVVTDHDLHTEGAALLQPYRTVVTGTHPEYHTRETLDGLLQYRDAGGRLVYLGGNGFYWKVAMHQQVMGAVEIRRGEGGIRAWASEPGEYYNAFDSEYGGLWRRNCRPPQELCGVGFSSQGLFEGSYYRVCKGVRDNPRVAWMLHGIAHDKLGDFGLCGGGAAGFELDRADFALGTPEHAVVLARSEGHSDKFVAVFEELLTTYSTIPGTEPSELVRADIVFFETRNGGAVFSVGSITFCGSLLINSCSNDISQLLRNVLTKFLDKDSFFQYRAPQPAAAAEEEVDAAARQLNELLQGTDEQSRTYTAFTFLGAI